MRLPRILRRCSCRPGCLAPVYPSDQTTDDGALVAHAAVALQPTPLPTRPVSPLSPRQRDVGGVPKRL